MVAVKLTHTLFVIRTVNSFGWSASMPFFAIYLELQRHVSLGYIGAAYLVSGVLSLLGQLTGGWLTDKLGSRKIMYVGYTSSILFSWLMYYFLHDVLSVVTLMVFYTCFSFFRAMSNPATSALIAAQKQRSTVVSGFSLQTMGGNIGFGLGPAVGGILSQYLGYPIVFALSGVAAGAALLLAAVFIGFKDSVEAGRKQTKLNPLRVKGLGKGAISFLMVVAALFFVNGYLYTPLSLYAAGFIHLSNQEIGLLFTTNGFLIAALQLPLVRALEKAGLTYRAPAVSAVLMFLAYLLVANTHNFTYFVVAMAIATVGEILLTVPTQLMVTAMSSPSNRGAYQGYYSAATSSGRSLASFVAPISFTLFDPARYAWYAVGLGSLVAGFVHLRVSTRVVEGTQYQVGGGQQS